MRTLQTLLSVLFAISSVTAQGSYAPINVTCPSNLIRSGETGLSPDETAYISQRKTKATQSLQTWLAGVNLQDFNVSKFLVNESNVPTMAIAFSGGGYRAMLNGAGVFQGIPPFPRSPLCGDVYVA
jgi:lysophospholipase